MRAIVVRHYRTLINACGRIMGWGDAPPARDWQDDVVYVDTVLREAGIRFDAVYSSYLGRARQTAMHLAKARKIPVIHDCEALNEVNYGILYRKSKSWVAKHYPLHKKDADFVYPGGESFRQMQTRCVNFVQSLAQDRHSSTILIVAHAGVIRGLICHFLGLDYDSNLRQKISHRYIGDFDLAGSVCTRYDEIGERSGFVQTGTVSLPFPIATERVS